MTNNAPPMRIDSHQHFWRLDRGDYDWLKPSHGQLYRDFLPADLAPHLSAARISATVVVQAAESVAETEFLLSLARENAIVAGVVGWVDMAKPDAIRTLEHLAQDQYFKGIRPMIQSMEDDTWLLRPELTPVFDALVALDLTFDALVRPRHLPHLLTRLARHPDLRCVINHIGKPDLSGPNLTDANLTGAHLTEWAADLGRLARETSTHCKFSGIPNLIGPGWTTDALRPAADIVRGLFGADRLMFGSDWPVLTVAGDYALWANAAENLTCDYDEAESAAFWGGTALRFYRLDRNPRAGITVDS